jgi:hypothetical protein
LSTEHAPETSQAWVELPPLVHGEFQVYVNGIEQQRGADYELDGRILVFRRPLVPEVKMSRLQWARVSLGIAGTYRKHDSVDVVYEHEGRRLVATGLRPRPTREP